MPLMSDSLANTATSRLDVEMTRSGPMVRRRRCKGIRHITQTKKQEVSEFQLSGANLQRTSEEPLVCIFLVPLPAGAKRFAREAGASRGTAFPSWSLGTSVTALVHASTSSARTDYQPVTAIKPFALSLSKGVRHFFHLVPKLQLGNEILIR
jgi:hypothetical protein